MKRGHVLSVATALLLAGAAGWSTREAASEPTGTSPTHAPTSALALALGASPSSAPRRAAADPRVDSAQEEFDAGRRWHASTRLRAAVRSGVQLIPEEALLLARADAGWRNWTGVVEGLAAKSWVDDTGGGEGWLLLARGHEARGDWAAAANAYDRYVTTAHAADDPLLPGIHGRHAGALARAGRGAEARAALDRIGAPVVTSWAALDAASASADSGRVADVRALLERVTDPGARMNAWEMLPRALLAARDSAGAEGAFREEARSVSGNRRARAWTWVGELARARADTTTARSAYLAALAVGTRTPAAPEAAAGALALAAGSDGLGAGQALTVARALHRVGYDGPALRAYDLHTRLRGGSTQADEAVRLDRASILAVTQGREDEAVREFRALSTSSRERVGAAALEHWAQLRRRQGRTGDVQTLRGWLLERYPSSAEAVDVLFFRGDGPHDRNELDAAAQAYRRVIEAAPDQDRAGLATMRVAQIHLLRGERSQALEVYDGYLTRFPSGRRWQEASYWAARVRLALGDSVRADELVGRLRRDDPLSYYTVLAAELIGEPFGLELSEGDAPPAPTWLAEGVLRVDLLRTAGLTEGEAAEVERLIGRAHARRGAMMWLAEALIARDHTIPAIGLGWALREDGAPWTLRLARIVFPWGYQAVFEGEGQEADIDPLLTAALARQESAFDPDIRSRANAVGLMQLLPSTAAEVARQVGPPGFREELLEVPDINVHLGTLHLRDLLRANQGDIARFLAGYNAGQHRVVRWREFAEAADPLTFTERIPFAETRDYVKKVRRNLALYRELYGSGGAAARTD